jgi:hypothetical protein
MKIEGDRIIISAAPIAEEVHEFASAAEAAGARGDHRPSVQLDRHTVSQLRRHQRRRRRRRLRHAGGSLLCRHRPPAAVRSAAVSAGWMLHHSEERFLGWIQDTLDAREVAAPRLGDVPVWKVGRCFSHCGIVVNSTEAIHSFRHVGFVTPSGMKATGIFRCDCVSRLDERFNLPGSCGAGRLHLPAGQMAWCGADIGLTCAWKVD